MRVRIDKSRHHYATLGIHNFRVANILFDLGTRPDALNLAVADEHPPVANDSERGQLCSDPRTFWSGQREELRRVQNSEWTHCSLRLKRDDRKSTVILNEVKLQRSGRSPRGQAFNL